LIDFELAWSILPNLLRGAVTTLWLVVVAVIAGLALALPIALARNSRSIFLSSTAYGYIFFFRGSPLLAQVFLLYYGAAQFAWLRETDLWIILREPYWCAAIALTFNTAAYTAEILRGAFRNIPVGLVDAAKALGLSSQNTFWLIKLPLVARLSLQAYSNEVVFLVKSTAVMSLITVIDLMGAANLVYRRTYNPVTPLLSAAFIYLVIIHGVVFLFRAIERRLSSHLVVRPDRRMNVRAAPARM
jgi:His/Glu/Gln/Arg/opine family amino acid ABC transporter permease subunit